MLYFKNVFDADNKKHPPFITIAIVLKYLLPLLER